MAARILLAVLVATAARADDTLADRWDKPKRESFDMKGAWPEHVVEELRKRYGVTFGLDAIDLKRADFAAKDVMFFEALDRFAAVHGLHVAGVPAPEGRRSAWETDLKLVRVEPPIPPTPVAYVGPSRFSVESVSVVALQRCAPAVEIPEEIVNEIGDEEIPRLRLRLRWIVPPGFEDAELLEWTCEEAVDDLAGRCAPIVTEFSSAVSANNRFAVDLRTPHEGAKKLARVELAVRIAVPVAREEIVFDASEVGATKDLGGARITLAGLETNGASFETKGSVNGESESTRIWPFRRGLSMSGVTLRAYSESGAEIEASPMFGRREAVGFEHTPKRLVLSAVTKLAIRQTTVVFTDVPLPR